MNTQPASKKEQLIPLELWDQLAVVQVKKMLAPTGFKKILNGKREVAAIDFLDKGRIDTVCAMSANMIRLYHVLLTEYLQGELKKATENNEAAEKALLDCNIFEIGAKESLKTLIAKTAIQKEVFTDLLKQVDLIKPASPKNQQKKAEPTKPKLEIVKA